MSEFGGVGLVGVGGREIGKALKSINWLIDNFLFMKINREMAGHSPTPYRLVA